LYHGLVLAAGLYHQHVNIDILTFFEVILLFLDAGGLPDLVCLEVVGKHIMWSLF